MTAPTFNFKNGNSFTKFRPVENASPEVNAYIRENNGSDQPIQIGVYNNGDSYRPLFVVSNTYCGLYDGASGEWAYRLYDWDTLKEEYGAVYRVINRLTDCYATTNPGSNQMFQLWFESSDFGKNGLIISDSTFSLFNVENQSTVWTVPRLAFPVGSYHIGYANKSPASYLGGQWVSSGTIVSPETPGCSLLLNLILYQRVA